MAKRTVTVSLKELNILEKSWAEQGQNGDPAARKIEREGDDMMTVITSTGERIDYVVGEKFHL